MKTLLIVSAIFVSMVSNAQETAPAPAATPTPAPAAQTAPPTAQPAIPAPAPAPVAPAAPEAPKAVVATTPAKTEASLGKVTQIFRDKKRLIMQVEASVADAEIPFVVTVATQPGELCEGQVMQTHAGKSLVEFTTCRAFDKIKVGADVHASLFQGPPTDQASIRTNNVPIVTNAQGSPQPQAEGADASELTEKQESKVAFTMSVGYHSGSALRFDDVNYSSTTGSGTGTMEYDIDPAAQLSVGAIFTRPHAWGSYFGVTIEESRRVKTAKATVDGGGTVTGLFLDPPKLTLFIAEANAMYRWDEFYLLFGLNYTVPRLQYSTASGSTFSVKGGMGGQLGVGLMLDNQIRLELVSMSMSMDLTETAPTARAEYGSGYLGGGLLRVGYVF